MQDSRFPDYLRTLDDPAGMPLEGPPREVVFHHQPKTAGSTLRQILERLFDPAEVCPGEIDDEVRGLAPEERRRYRFFAGHYKYDTLEDLFPDAIWLTVLRNPIDRVVSNFYNLANHERHPPHWVARAQARPQVLAFLEKVRDMTLEEFVHSDEPRARDRVMNRQTRYLTRHVSAEETPLHDEALLDRAKRNLREQFAYVGIQEHFTLSLQLLEMTFGLPPIARPERFHTNINVVGKSEEGYELSESVRARLEECNRMDLEIWRYGQEIMFERLRAFQNYFIERDYILRLEMSGRGIPDLRRDRSLSTIPEGIEGTVFVRWPRKMKRLLERIVLK